MNIKKIKKTFIILISLIVILGIILIYNKKMKNEKTIKESDISLNVEPNEIIIEENKNKLSKHNHEHFINASKTITHNLKDSLNSEDKKVYDTSNLKIIEDLENAYLEVNTKVTNEDKDIIMNDSKLWFDFENNISKTDATILQISQEKNDTIVYQDATKGIIYQCENFKDNENDVWTKTINEPYNISETIYDFSFNSLCGSNWYLKNETDTEIYLTRDLNDMLNSDFMESYFISIFKDKNIELKNYDAEIIIDKNDNRLKTYNENLIFTADKINNGIFDNTEQVEYKAIVTIELNDINVMKPIIIPENVLSTLTEEEINSQANEEQEEQKEIEETISTTEEENNITYIPQKVIIDTDYASDADDILALELAMVYNNHNIIDLIGVVLSTTYSRSPMALHNQLSKNGYGYIPVAMDTVHGVQVETNYVDVMYEGGSSEYEQPVTMYRRLLSNTDSKVNIITLGFTQNLEDLLKSQPDNYSSLNGIDLVSEKVNTVYIVGGNLKNRPSFNFYWGKGRNTTTAAQYVYKTLPVRTIYITEEMGNDVFCGGFYNQQDKNQRNLITKALKSNNQEYGVVAWDPFAVYCMVSDIQNTLEENNFILKNGIPYISDTGVFEWTDTDYETGKYRIEKSKYGGDYNQILNALLNEIFSY